MLSFKQEFSYIDPLYIIFLCGSQYSVNDNTDKRNVLKTFLEQNLTGVRPIILEEHFQFRVTDTKYLSYDDIFLKTLSEVEQLAALFAKRIIIIHESISTGSELGMFAINPDLINKICLLTPDTISIEENKVTNFIRLAFMKDKTKNISNITYYPDLEVKRISSDKSNYFTFFHNNKIGKNLGEKLIQFIDITNDNQKLSFVNSRFDKPNDDTHKIAYHVDEANKVINVYIHANALKIQLFSLLFLNNLRNECREKHPISKHVTCFEKTYKSIVKNTVSDLTGIEQNRYNLNIILNSSICNLREAIGYYIYLLQATGLIGLKCKDNPKLRKMTFTHELNNYKQFFANYIYEPAETAFGELMK